LLVTRPPKLIARREEEAIAMAELCGSAVGRRELLTTLVAMAVPAKVNQLQRRGEGIDDGEYLPISNDIVDK